MVTRAQLASLEWAGNGGGSETWCPVCNRPKSDAEGHTADCWLAAALAQPPVTAPDNPFRDYLDAPRGSRAEADALERMAKRGEVTAPAAMPPADLVALVQAWREAVYDYADGRGTVGALMKHGSNLADALEAMRPAPAATEGT